MTRHWTVSIDGGAPVHLDLAQYAGAIERSKQEGKPAHMMIEANPTIEMRLPTGSRAENPPGRQGRLSGHIVCHAGLVSIRFPPHWLHRSRRPASGTMIVSGNASTFTSVSYPQA